MKLIFPIPILFFTSLFVMVNLSCGNNTKNGKIVAKVGDTYLYASDLSGFGTNADSADFVKNYVAKWINIQILLQHASGNQIGNDEEINAKVEKYKQDLQLAAYEKQFLSKNLDTNITQKQVAEFYKNNSSLFELRDYVVNVFYMKFDISEKNNSKIGNDIKACKNSDDAKKIEDKYASLSVNAYLEPDSWIFMSDLMREIPMDITDKSAFLKNNSFYETRTEDDIYYVRIFDYKLKNETSPVNLVEKKIKTLILQERTQKLISDNRNKIIKAFYAKNDVQNFTK